MQVVSLRQLIAETMMQIYVDDRPVLLFHEAGDVFATDAFCTHMQAPLRHAYRNGPHLTCPWHRGAFDIRTGRAVGEPCTTDLRTYPVSVEGDCVRVRID